jgi:hypothetical protein
LITFLRSDAATLKSKHPLFRSLIFAVFVGMGVLIFAIGAGVFYQNEEFSGGDVAHVTGTVTSRYVSYAHYGRMSGGIRPVEYHLSYSFLDSTAHGFVSSSIVAEQTYDNVREHDAVPVKYLAHSPGINRLDLPAEDSRYRLMAWGLMAFGLFFGGLSWLFFRTPAK